MAKKIQKLKSDAAGGNKDAENVLKLLDLTKYEPLTQWGKMKNFIVRLIVISTFMGLQFCMKLGGHHFCYVEVAELALQALLIAFYCFEKKVEDAQMDIKTGLRLFEKQWFYQMGFGLPTILFIFYTKHLGSSMYFFIFPIINVMSIDEDGQGLLLTHQDRQA